MKEVIYLVVNSKKVERLTRNLPDLKRGEVPVKLTLIVDPKAFRVPTIDKEVYIDDWREGIDLEDVEFKKNIITQGEAEEIKQKRLAKMKEIMEQQGWTVTKNEEEE